jgi:hypothetical protein
VFDTDQLREETMSTKKPEPLSLEQLEAVTGGAIYYYYPRPPRPRSPRGNRPR